VRHLNRWPVGTSYPAIARDVSRMLETDPLKDCVMAIDQTGVGRTIVDQFRQLQAFADIRAITLTQGQRCIGIIEANTCRSWNSPA
jgi:hypothetical protein